jgi:DNA-binding transcriptional ArsR family regulator
VVPDAALARHSPRRGPRVPDPTPGLLSVGIDEEADALLRATSDRIGSELGHVFGDDPRPALAALADRFRAVHDAIIAPVWPRLAGVLLGDVERRGRLLVDAGWTRVLDELHESVGWEAGRLAVGTTRVDPGERDLVLLPSAFVWPDVYLRQSPVRLALCYPAHGFGTLWERANAPRPALGQLLGRSRARLLLELDRPASVSELAARLDVTAGAISQHLSVLRAAGLVVSQRDGRTTISLRTALGHALVQGGV